MTKVKIFTASSPQELEKEMNGFLQELTNAEVVSANYQLGAAGGSPQLSCLLIYRINNEGTKFGSA